MSCTCCGKKLSVYNPMRVCYACDDMVDDWEEQVRLPCDNVWESYPPPRDGERLVHYIRRLLTHSGGSVPVYEICHHWGFKKKKVDSALSGARRWFERRGCKVILRQNGSGYSVVQCEM